MVLPQRRKQRLSLRFAVGSMSGLPLLAGDDSGGGAPRRRDGPTLHPYNGLLFVLPNANYQNWSAFSSWSPERETAKPVPDSLHIDLRQG